MNEPHNEATPQRTDFDSGDQYENYTERAAILEYDAADIYPTRELAEIAAYELVTGRKWRTKQ
jgi:hypothetical protein